MAANCVTQACLCLADRIDPQKNVCASISRESGTIRPCDHGCCVPRCTDPSSLTPANFDIEYKVINPSSDETPIPKPEVTDQVPILEVAGATPIAPPELERYQVWLIVMGVFAFVALVAFIISRM